MSLPSRRDLLRRTLLVPVLPVVAAAQEQGEDPRDLSYYTDARGKRKPLRTPADARRRRENTLEAMQRVMGPLPAPVGAPLEAQVLEEVHLEGYRRRLLRLAVSSRHVVPAYLFLPNGPAVRRPALLCLHQTTRIGKGEPAGLGGMPNLHYALELARRGYVTLAPDYPSFGDYPCDFSPGDGWASGSMRAIADNRRAVDYLQSLPEVRGDRLGVIGHSLGGHNALFTAAWDERLKVVVTSCGFTRFHRYYGGRLAGWSSPRYMPRIATDYGNDPDRVPFDFPAVLAAIAPRAVFTSSPLRDDNFEVTGVRESIAMAEGVFRLYGASANLRAHYPDCGHDFPPESRQAAYRFLAEQLIRR